MTEARPSRKKSVSASGRGISLVEIMVATGLLSAAILLSMGLLPSFKMSNRRANMEIQAGALAQSSLENYRAAGFANLASGNDTVVKDDLSYNRETLVTESASGLAKTVRVTLSWEWKGRTITTFRETVISRVPRS